MAEKRLKASIVIGGLLDGSLRAALSSTKNGFRQIGDAMRGARREQRQLKQEIASLESAGRPIDATVRRYNILASTIDKARSAAERLREAEQRQVRAAEVSSRLRTGATRAAVVGGSVVAAMASPIAQASTSQIITLKASSIGIDRKEVAGALDFARRQKIFGVSQNEKSEMMSDLLGAFGEREAAEHALPTLAKMKFAQMTRYGNVSPEDAERDAVTAGRVIDARGGARSQSLFDTQADYVNRSIQATSGAVTSEMLRQMQTHGGAAMNAMSDRGFYLHAASLANETHDASGVGTGSLSAYQNLYQGKTTKRAVENLDKLGLIGDRSKVKFDKVGQASFLNPGALLGADVFRRDQFEWVTKVLVPALKKKGITDNKGITDAIASIVSNSNGAKLLQNYYLNQRQIERDEKNAQSSPSIDQASKEAQGTARGQQIGLTSKLHDLQLGIGAKLLPAYTSALIHANGALDKLNSFTKEHPKLARNMALAVAGGAAALLVAVPLMFAAGIALNAYGNFALLATRREAALTAATLLNTVATGENATIQAASLSRFGGMSRAIGSVAIAPFRAVGLAVRGIGIAFGLLLSPVGIAVLAIGAAAILVYKYWEPIKAFFTGVWEGIKQGVGPLGPTITAAFSPIVGVVKSIWGWFTRLLEPVHLTKSGMASATDAGVSFGKTVGDAIRGVVGWLEKAVGYFTWIASHGASAVSSIWHSVSGTVSAPTPPLLTDPASLPEIPSVTNDNRQTVNRGDTVSHTYHIHQQPGESAEDLARRIHEGNQRSERNRSTLFDQAD